MRTVGLRGAVALGLLVVLGLAAPVASIADTGQKTFRLKNPYNKPAYDVHFDVWGENKGIVTISTVTPSPTGWTGSSNGSNRASAETTNNPIRATPYGYIDVTVVSDPPPRTFDNVIWTDAKSDPLAAAPTDPGWVAPSGTMLTLEGDEGALEFPAGAVSTDTWVWASMVPNVVLMDYYGTGTDDGREIAKAVELGPEGQVFAQPVTVRLSYASLSGLGDLRAYSYDPESERWSPMVGSWVDSAHQQVVFPVTHFSLYGLGGEPIEVVPASSPWSLAVLILVGTALGSLALYRKKDSSGSLSA